MRISSLLLLTYLSQSSASGGDCYTASHWDYDFTTVNDNCKSPYSGPYCWSKGCSTCGGEEQSPINVAGSGVTVAHSNDLQKLVHSGTCKTYSFKNNGHSLQATLDQTCDVTTTFGGDEYKLLQFHVHSPSEHKIGGATFDGEIHMVHSKTTGTVTKKGNSSWSCSTKPCYFVVGVLFKQSVYSPTAQSDYTTNTFLANFLGDGFDEITGVAFTAGKNRFGPPTFAAGPSSGQTLDPFTQLLPPNPSYYAYDGSFTTPPCTENVQWALMAQPVQVGWTQMVQIRTFLSQKNNNLNNQGMPKKQYRNNRPTQMLGTRTVQFLNVLSQS